MENMLNRYFIVFILFISFLSKSSATHNRAGEILIRQIGPLTIEATVVTFTKTSSSSADRDSLTIDWGNGKRTTVARINGPKGKSGVPIGEELPNDIKKNLYVAIHTYSGFAPFYVITMSDPMRNAGILNVNPPFSDNVQFSLATTFTFLNQQFQGTNSTPVLLQPPIDFGCVGEVFVHNPNAYDVDKDSLFFQLTEPRAAPGVKVPNYIYPNKVATSSSGNNFLTLNEKTGELIWDSPRRAGEYNVTIMIIEFRNGIAIDTTLRDMQIEILDNCKNAPPILQVPKDICVVAGTLIDFEVIASDNDVIPKVQKVNLTALGGPLVTKYSPATFTAPNGFQNSPVKGRFRWQTDCEHISNQYYNVVFKAVDNFLADTTGLAILKTVRIKVVAPAPENLQVASNKGTVKLNWDNPYDCDAVAEDYFFGFSIWRRENSSPFTQDTCNPTMKNRGYKRIGLKWKQINNNRYEFIDNTAERGITYCYRVQGEFAKLTSVGNPYNLVEGIATPEACVQLNRDVPLPVEVDVVKTDATNGEIMVRWNKPNPNDLDTISNKAPYKCELYHANSLNGTYSVVYTSIWNDFKNAIDTFYNHQNINTLEQHFYKIVFYSNNDPKATGTSPVASSILLKIAPTDRTNILTWTEKTPWANSNYAIYRKNDITGQFDSIGSSKVNIYRDENLVNKKNYCYYVKSFGAYSIKEIRQPLVNRSQEFCSTPIDNIAPCAPKLTVKNICNDTKAELSDTTTNHLIWLDVTKNCANAKDLAGYSVFFTEVEGGQFRELNTTTDTFFNHIELKSLAGCYYVIAYDSLNNKSAASNVFCVDNCPIFELPNTFTPNSDGQNDIFKPFPNSKFIAKVEFKIFNRWGNLIFETNDPHINWDGKNLNGEDVAESVYYYQCKVFEQRVNGIVARDEILSGFIHVFR